MTSNETSGAMVLRTLLRSRVVATVACLVVVAGSLETAGANIPRVSAATPAAIANIEAAAGVLRREPSSRHEPAMLDKLEGAELANPQTLAPPVGVVVVDVRFASAMWRNGLRPGDVILAVDRMRVASLDDLRFALGKVGWGFVLDVERNGQRLRIDVP